MKRLILSLTAALAASMMLASVALADAIPVGNGTFMPDVKATDDFTAEQGVWISDFVKTLDSNFASTWNWRSSMPVTYYLYPDGQSMANAIGTFRGAVLTPDQMNDVIAHWQAFIVQDTTTNGWAILLDLSKGFGGPEYQKAIMAAITHDYGELMLQELVPGAGPDWYRQGLIDQMEFTMVPGLNLQAIRIDAAQSALGASLLPPLSSLDTAFPSMIATEGENNDLAFGQADVALQFLANRFGGMPLLQTLMNVRAGHSFNDALMAATGWDVATLDSQYRSFLMNGAMPGSTPTP